MWFIWVGTCMKSSKGCGAFNSVKQVTQQPVFYMSKLSNLLFNSVSLFVKKEKQGKLDLL